MNCLVRPHDFVGGASFTAHIKESICILVVCLSVATPAFAQQVAAAGPMPGSIGESAIAAPDPQPGSISGTVTDVDNDIVPGANVVLEGSAPGEHRAIVAKDD